VGGSTAYSIVGIMKQQNFSLNDSGHVKLWQSGLMVFDQLNIVSEWAEHNCTVA
jgi:hypothetical protein